MSAKQPTAKQRARWEEIRALGCVLQHRECNGETEIHHCFTNGGGRRDHDKVIPLCEVHHRGARGIHTLKHKQWQPVYGYERDLITLMEEMLRDGD